MSPPPLPRLAVWLLTVAVPADWRESIAGDVDEERRRRLAAGRRAGALWCVAAAIRVAAALQREQRAARIAGRFTTRSAPMTGITSDIAYAVRGLRAHPGYAAAAVLTLALGIGANAAVFSLTNWLLLRPIPGVRDPGEMVTLIYAVGDSGATFLVSVPLLRSLESGVSGLSGLTGYQPQPMNVTPVGGGSPRRLEAEVVWGNYFSVLMEEMARGRPFTPAEGRDPGGDPAVVISDRFWRDDLGSDPGVVGRSLLVNGERFTIVGVATHGFHGTSRTSATDLWVPISQYRRVMPQYSATLFSNPRESFFFALVGRMRAGATAAVVASEANAVQAALRTANPTDKWLQRARFLVRPGIDTTPWARARLTSSLSLVMGIATLLLVLTCANVANLVLGRSTGRRTEIATRLALGASRARVARLLLAESAVLACLASAVALTVAWMAARALEGTVVLQNLPPLGRAEMDWRVTAFALLAAAVAAVGAGVVPAFSSSRVDLQGALREHGRSRTVARGRLRRVLTVAQVAVSLTLVAGAFLLVRSMAMRHAINPGFDPSRVLVFSVEPRLPGYDEARKTTFYRDLMDRVREVPGVRSAGLSWSQPYGPIGNDGDYWVKNRPEQKVDAEDNFVSSGFFEAIGLRFVSGRDFAPSEGLTITDVEGPVIINESAARKLFGDAPAAGQRIVLAHPENAVRVVVGVVSDMRQRQFMQPPEPMLFAPFNGASDWATVVVGLSERPVAVVPRLRQAVAAVEPRLPVFGVTTLGDAIDAQLADDILVTRLTMVFGVLATMLAAVGLYGVLARGVAERRREFSIRAALGAGPAAMARLVSGDALRVTAMGVVCGLAAATWLTRFLRAYLYGVDRLDPLALAGAVLLLAVVALAATLVPARRAATVDPAAELK
jgi:putative ABC transport system permease protein